MHGSVIFEIISILNCFFYVETWMSLQRCIVLWSLKSFWYWTVFFSRNLNVPTKNVRFCHHCNHFNTNLSFSDGVWISAQRMYSSVIFEIISILNCLFQLEFECPHKRCKVLSSLKSFAYCTAFSSWILNVPMKDVSFFQLKLECANNECKGLSSL